MPNSNITIYDPYGREVDLDLLEVEQAAPTFGGIRTIFGNVWPSSNLTPQKLLSILRLSEFGDPYLALELYEEMEEKDNHLLAVLNKRKGAVCGLEMIVEPASQSKPDMQIAEFVRQILLDDSADLNLRESLYDIQDAIGKGFSCTEIMWDTERRLVTSDGSLSGNWWVPTRLEWRDPRWFMFDWISGRQVLVRTLKPVGDTIDVRNKLVGGQHLSGNWVWNDQAVKFGIQPLTEPLIPYKFITHFGRAKSGLPIRAGLDRCLAWTYLFKITAQKDWANFLEKFGMPLRLGKYPPGATDADKKILLAAAAGIGADMAGIIPSSMGIEFEAASGAVGNNTMYDTYMEHLENLESKVVLGSTLGTQLRGTQGSKAATSEHRDVEGEIVATDAMRLETTLNRDIVRPLVDLNFGAQARYPRLRLGLPDEEDMERWSKIIGELARAGMRIPVKPIRDKLKLPAPEEGEEILTPPISIGAKPEELPGALGYAHPPMASPPSAPAAPSGQPGGTRAQVPARRALPAPSTPPAPPLATSPRERRRDETTRAPDRPRTEEPYSIPGRRRLGLPDEEARARSARQARQDRHARRNGGSPASRPHASVRHPMDMVDEFAENMAGEWNEIMPGMLQPILRAVRKARNYRELESSLNDICGKMDATEFQKRAARAFMNTVLAGAATSPAGR